METKDSKKFSQPHPAFHRAMSDIAFYLSVAIAFCPDEFTMNELIGAHKGIGKLYKELLAKIKDSENTIDNGANKQ